MSSSAASIIIRLGKWPQKKLVLSGENAYSIVVSTENAGCNDGM